MRIIALHYIHGTYRTYNGPIFLSEHSLHETNCPTTSARQLLIALIAHETQSSSGNLASVYSHICYFHSRYSTLPWLTLMRCL